MMFSIAGVSFLVSRSRKMIPNILNVIKVTVNPFEEPLVLCLFGGELRFCLTTNTL